jgi:NADH dehydrogenase
MPTGLRPRVVIIGGGFGGLSAAKHLKGANVDITLIDKQNYHLFQPLLYQVAAAALSPGDVAQPLRSILRSHDNVHVVMESVTSIDTQQRRVHTDTSVHEYDWLIAAPGSRHSYFGHEAWEQHAPGLKDLSDALAIRERVLRAFERADLVAGTPAAAEALTFVLVGGGPTGVELAGAFAEIALRTMLPDFPRLQRSDVRIILVQASERLLEAFTPEQSQIARHELETMGVEVRLHAPVTQVTAHGVQIGTEWVATQTVIWAAGNAASPILSSLPAEHDRVGRVVVGPDCTIPDHPNVFVIGDGAMHLDEHNKPLPGVAQVAMQQGRYVADIIREATPREARAPFRYKDKGTMATIGRARAVATISGFSFSGLLAWLLWAGLHIFFLIGFRNRLKVLVEWLWYYVSFQPGARLITSRAASGPAAPPHDHHSQPQQTP